MKRSYWIVGGIGVGLLFFGTLVNFLMSFGASRTADRFLALLSDGQSAQAYNMTTRTYRQAVKPKDFERLTRLWKLRDFAGKEDWETQAANDQVTVIGTVRTKSGDPVPLRIQLLKEDGDWKIASFEGPPPPQTRYITLRGLSSWRHSRDRRDNPPSPPLPSQEEIVHLVCSTLLELDKALDTGDFNDFHASVSDEWKEHVPVAMFERALSPLGEHNLDIGKVASAQPEFSRPVEIRSDGMLIAE